MGLLRRCHRHVSDSHGSVGRQYRSARNLGTLRCRPSHRPVALTRLRAGDQRRHHADGSTFGHGRPQTSLRNGDSHFHIVRRVRRHVSIFEPVDHRQSIAGHRFLCNPGKRHGCDNGSVPRARPRQGDGNVYGNHRLWRHHRPHRRGVAGRLLRVEVCVLRRSACRHCRHHCNDAGSERPIRRASLYWLQGEIRLAGRRVVFWFTGGVFVGDD